MYPICEVGSVWLIINRTTAPFDLCSVRIPFSCRRACPPRTVVLERAPWRQTRVIHTSDLEPRTWNLEPVKCTSIADHRSVALSARVIGEVAEEVDRYCSLSLRVPISMCALTVFFFCLLPSKGDDIFAGSGVYKTPFDIL